MDSKNNQLNSLGYSDCFYQNGELWGFLRDGVIPLPVPTEIIHAAEQQDKQDRLSDWPEFSRKQRLTFWRDRIWHNFQQRLNRNNSFSSFEINNVVIPAQRGLLLGDTILYQTRETHEKYRGCDLFYSFGRKWNQILEIEIHDENWPNSRFIINPKNEGCERALVTSCQSIIAFNELSPLFKQNITTWIISNCDRELADVISGETGYSAHYFYALPSHLFWVYYRAEKRLILGKVDNRELWYDKIKRLINSLSKITKIASICTIIFAFGPPGSIIHLLSLISLQIAIFGIAWSFRHIFEVIEFK